MHAAECLLLVLWLQNIKTDHQKSWPSNVLPKKNLLPYFEKQNFRHSQLI